MMSGTMAIGDFLHRIKRPIELEPEKLYKLVTVNVDPQVHQEKGTKLIDT